MRKSTMLAGIVFLLSFQILAFNYGDGYQTDYISWCSENKVMQYNQNGEVFMRFNCGEYNQSCKSYQKITGRKMLVIAACENN